MAARAIWKAVLRIGGATLPVKFYSAVEDRNVHFHLLHDKDLVRVKQRMAHSETGETVAYENTKRGVVLESDRIVVLDDEDLDALVPEPSRDVEVAEFLPGDAIDPEWYDRPYYLGPDGDDDAYFALAAALADADRQGLAHWVMRKQEYSGALVAHDGYLVMITLRPPGEVIDAGELSPPEGRELPSKERKLAAQLIDALKGDFDPSDYRDTYRDRVREMIAAKARGEAFEVEEYEEAPESESLSESLEASLKAARR